MYNSSKKIIHHVYASRGNNPFVDIQLCSYDTQSPYFSITTNTGCDHERIARLYPELKPFIDLHLSYIDGSPIHTEENGFYHYAEGVKENGEGYYFPSKEAKENEEERIDHEAFCAFHQATHIEYGLACDIWASISSYIAWRKGYYTGDLFKSAQDFYHNKPNVHTKVVTARNNKHLAAHLRISLEEATAIPAGLTQAAFNKMHVEPHKERWQDEANAAIALLKEWEELYPPFDDGIEEDTHYFYGVDKYNERLPEIKKQRENRRAYPLR